MKMPMGKIRAWMTLGLLAAAALTATMPLAWCSGAGGHLAVESAFASCPNEEGGACACAGIPTRVGSPANPPPGSGLAVAAPLHSHDGCEDYSIRSLLPRLTQGGKKIDRGFAPVDCARAVQTTPRGHRSPVDPGASPPPLTKTPLDLRTTLRI